MKSAFWIAGVLGLAAVTVMAGQAAKQDKPAKPAPEPTKGQVPEEWMKAMMPGAAHKRLEPLVGTWDVKTTFWMAGPESQPETGTGTDVSKWVLDGRWVQGDYTATWMDQPFHGIAFIGYDNAEQKYVNTWVDNMGTGMMYATGTADAAGKVFTLTTQQCTCPMTGKRLTCRSVLTIVSNDKHTHEMFHTYAGEKEFRAGEIIYTRKK